MRVHCFDSSSGVDYFILELAVVSQDTSVSSLGGFRWNNSTKCLSILINETVEGSKYFQFLFEYLK